MSAILSLALATATLVSAPAPSSPEAVIARWVRGTAQDRARVDVWLDQNDVFNRGDRARVYFRSDRDAYITIIRIDTDGRVRVLFPMDPWEDNWARGGKTFEVLGRDRDEAFRIDDYPGVGYIFAIASADPFNYDDLVRGDHWDYRAISDGRVRGDPYVAVADLAERIAREGDYDYDVAEYNVERHYDYPRFVCYDCHTYASWRYWDPYSHYCSRFRIVIYDDWYYYPYRYYGGGTVIIRPHRPGPRYVFKDHDSRNDYVTRVAERPRVPDDRRPTIDRDRDRTSADIGGRGAIPAPVSPRRRTGDNAGAGVSRPEEPRRRTGGTAGPGVSQPEEPRRRTGTTEARPDNQGEPRRGSQPDRTREPATTRQAPEAGESPRRRPANDGESNRLRETNPGRSGSGRSGAESVDRDRRPARAEDSPRYDAQRERPRESTRSAPPAERPRTEAPRERPRESTRSAPSAERPRSEPRSAPAPAPRGGQPELKRRRPN